VGYLIDAVRERALKRSTRIVASHVHSPHLRSATGLSHNRTLRPSRPDRRTWPDGRDSGVSAKDRCLYTAGRSAPCITPLSRANRRLRRTHLGQHRSALAPQVPLSGPGRSAGIGVTLPLDTRRSGYEQCGERCHGSDSLELSTSLASREYTGTSLPGRRKWTVRGIEKNCHLV
jgi:hypothetical protein